MTRSSPRRRVRARSVVGGSSGWTRTRGGVRRRAWFERWRAAATRSSSLTRRSTRCYVALPNALHVEWLDPRRSKRASTCCARSRSGATSRGRRAFDAAERAGLVLLEAFMYRHHPQIKRARELLDEGAIGELRLVRALGVLLTRSDGADNVRLGRRARRRRAARRRLLLRQRPAAPRGRAADRLRRAGADRRSGVDVRFAGHARGSPATSSATFDCGMDAPPRHESRGGRHRGLAAVSTTRVTARRRVIELRHDVRRHEVERDRGRARRRYRLQLENFAPGDRRRGAAAARP